MLYFILSINTFHLFFLIKSISILIDDQTIKIKLIKCDSQLIDYNYFKNVITVYYFLNILYNILLSF